MPQKLIQLTLFLSFVLLFLPKTAFADINDFTITPTPNPPTISTKNMTISIKRKDSSDFFVGANYSAIIWKGDSPVPDRSDKCTLKNFKDRESRDAKLNLTWSRPETVANWAINPDCATKPGEMWHFKLWAGENWDATNNPSNIIIPDYPFTFTQPNGNLVTISAKNPVVYTNEEPIVILSNSIAGDKYSFWWSGDLFEIARHYPESIDHPGPSGPVEINITTFKTNQSSRTLCMAYGWYIVVPPGYGCNPSAVFNFETGRPRPAVPTGPPTCKILPSNNPPLNSQVNIKIENLPAGTKVRTFVVDKDGNILSNSLGISDNTFTALYELIKQASTGTYHTVTYYDNPENKKVCDPDIEIIVGGVPTLPAATPCTDLKNCSSGGGKDTPGCTDATKPDPTNPNKTIPNPGIATAIGCIHTSPAEFTKDLLKFIIGIGGGLAFLMMLLGAYQMLSSGGNPEGLKAGQDRLTSAVIGLLFIIFSILLLQIIGVGILNIPGFGM